MLFVKVEIWSYAYEQESGNGVLGYHYKLIHVELSELQREIVVAVELTKKAICENAHMAKSEDAWNKHNKLRQ